MNGETKSEERVPTRWLFASSLASVTGEGGEEKFGASLAFNQRSLYGVAI
jgi:hypothetical protein